MSKILIIEDEEPIRRVLVRILTDEDSSFEIHEASDGKKGLDLIKNDSYDLVLCDIKMPKVDKLKLFDGVDEIDLIRSGLNDMMVDAYQNIRGQMLRSKLPNLKIASFKLALEKIAGAYDTIAL
jgi:CheY-like chemotaxis protein